MSGVAPDPLDDLAQRKPVGTLGTVHLTPEERDALVEVARAARDTASRIVDGPEFDLGELFNSAGRLDAALARLDKGALP